MQFSKKVTANEYDLVNAYMKELNISDVKRDDLLKGTPRQEENFDTYFYKKNDNPYISFNASIADEVCFIKYEKKTDYEDLGPVVTVRKEAIFTLKSDSLLVNVTESSNVSNSLTKEGKNVVDNVQDMKNVKNIKSLRRDILPSKEKIMIKKA